jgi:hypothetical protein
MTTPAANHTSSLLLPPSSSPHSLPPTTSPPPQTPCPAAGLVPVAVASADPASTRSLHRPSTEQQKLAAVVVDDDNDSRGAPHSKAAASSETAEPFTSKLRQHRLSSKPSFSTILHTPSTTTTTSSNNNNNSSSSSSTTVGEDLSHIANLARDRLSPVLSTLGIKAKTSASSLRSRNPSVSHAKTYSTGAAASSQGIWNGSSNLAPRQTLAASHVSAASLASQDEPLTRTEKHTPDVTLERPSLDSRQSSDTRRLLRRDPPSSSRLQQSDSMPAMITPQNKMHQTSSRLLRMTDEERPFTRDFKDLFSTLMVSLPLSAHRVRWQKIDHTFTSEEAINNLGSLKFSQSNRMPDPKDPSRIVTTTTTTTFSMAKEMARSVCQRFMDARFIEPADGKTAGIFPLKGALWQMSPKGMHVLQRFCQRNGIAQRHVLDVLDSPRNTMQLVILERDASSDKLSSDRATVDVIFRRFAGIDGPNIKASVNTSDSDSVSDYYNGLVGVKMAREREIAGRGKVQNSFTGKAAVDWLLDCCTTVDRRETHEIAELFVTQGLLYTVAEDKVYARQNLSASRFQPTKDAIYALTEKGQRAAGWIKRSSSPVSHEPRETARSNNQNANRGGGGVGGAPRDSNNNRLLVIVNDAALRLLFREYLRDTHCEENLSFYLEVRDFTHTYDISERAKAFTRLDAIRENLAAAYGTSANLVSLVSSLPVRANVC